MGLEVELEYEEEVTCPQCGFVHTIKGITTGEIEPPERDGPDY